MGKLVQKQSEFANNVALLIEYCRVNEVTLTFGEAYRTVEQQNLHYISGKSKTRHSKHQDRLAVDFNFFIDGELTYNRTKLQHIGDYWESLHPDNKWGGNFKRFVDTPHFQRT